MTGPMNRACETCGATLSRWRRNDRPGEVYRYYCLPCQNKRLQQYRAKHAGASTMWNRRWQTDNPDKRRAHKAVEKALRSGNLKKLPCERCGRIDGVHAHHESYARPLDVNWLCPAHHAQRHEEMEAARAA